MEENREENIKMKIRVKKLNNSDMKLHKKIV